MCEITFNKENEHGQSQMALLFDMPLEEDLTNWRKIKILVAPNGLKEVVYENNKTKEEYVDQGFVERSIGVAPERTCNLGGNIQAQRKQYGLKHCVTSTIYINLCLFTLLGASILTT